MAKPNLLLVDGDARTRRVLEVSLRKAGFLVTAAESGADAFDKAKALVPDLIISDTELPEVSGFEFCERVKADEALVKIPFIFLTNQRSIDHKVRGLELGVEEYLTKPIFVKEIVIRIKVLLQRRERETLADRDGRTTFSGDLADMAVVDLIQTLELGRKSGIIHFRNDAGRRGAIYFRGGKIIDAELGHLQGDSAIYRLLIWNDGHFDVEFRTIRRKDVIEQTNQSLLMEGMRRVDEWGRLLEQLPPLDTTFEVDYALLAECLGEIPDEMNAIIKLFDGRRTLLSVVDDSACGDLEALEVISKLYFEGLVFDVSGSVARSERASGEWSTEQVAPSADIQRGDAFARALQAEAVRTSVDGVRVAPPSDSAAEASDSRRPTLEEYGLSQRATGPIDARAARAAVARSRGLADIGTTQPLEVAHASRSQETADSATTLGSALDAPPEAAVDEFAVEGGSGASHVPEDLRQPRTTGDWSQQAARAREMPDDAPTSEHPFFDSGDPSPRRPAMATALYGSPESGVASGSPSEAPSEAGETRDGDTDKHTSVEREGTSRQRTALGDMQRQIATERHDTIEAGEFPDGPLQTSETLVVDGGDTKIGLAPPRAITASGVAAVAATEAGTPSHGDAVSVDAVSVDAVSVDAVSVDAVSVDAVNGDAVNGDAVNGDAVTDSEGAGSHGADSVDADSDADSDGADSVGDAMGTAAVPVPVAEPSAEGVAPVVTGPGDGDPVGEFDPDGTPLPNAAQLDSWLDDDGEDSAGGAIIPFPSKGSGSDDEVADHAASRSARRSGASDPSSASIDIQDEAFFASDYQPDTYEDTDYYEPERRPTGRGLWVFLALLIIAGGTAIAVWAYIKKSPYYGDGPKHLQIRARHASITGAGSGSVAAGRALAGSGASGSARGSAAASAGSASRAGTAEGSGAGTSVGAALASGSGTAKAAAGTASAAGTAIGASTGTSTGSAAGTSGTSAGTGHIAAGTAAGTSGTSGTSAGTAAAPGDGYDALVARARAELTKRRKRSAFKLFARAHKLKPAGWEALEQLALRDMERGKMKRALTLARKAEAAHADAPFAQLVIGSVLAESKVTRVPAKKALNRFLELCPKCPYAKDIRTYVKTLK